MFLIVLLIRVALKLPLPLVVSADTELSQRSDQDVVKISNYMLGCKGSSESDPDIAFDHLKSIHVGLEPRSEVSPTSKPSWFTSCITK